MGKSFHLVRPLEPPLLAVEDRVMFIPRGKELVVEKQEARVMLICEGRFRVMVDEHSLEEVGPGDILIVAGTRRLVYRPLQDRTETRVHIFRMVLDCSKLGMNPRTGLPRRRKKGQEETEFTAFLQNYFGRLVHLVRGQTPAMNELLRAIRQDAESETPGFRHRVSARTRLLLCLIGEQLAAVDAPLAGRVGLSRQTWISEQAKEYLLTHASEPLTLQDVARHLRVSAEHLSRVFKRETAITVFDFLRDVRIDQARSLLASAHFSINEIARRVGYSSTTLFCRNFKRATGVTPMTYREAGGGRWAFSGGSLRDARR